MWKKILCIPIALLSYLSADTRVSGINSFHIDPQLVANEDGEALIVWNTGGSLGGMIEYSLRPNATSSFTSAVPMTGLTISSQYVAAAMNHHHEALIVWNTVTGGIQYAVYDQSVHAMSPARSVLKTTPYSSNPSVTLNDEGDGIAVWSDANQSILYASYHRINKGFTPAQTLVNAKTRQNVQVALNAQGEGLLVWYDAKKQLLSYAVYKDNSYFGVSKTIANTQNALNPSLVLNSKGDALLAWNTGSDQTPAGFLQYAVYNKEAQMFEGLRTISASKEGLAQNMLPQVVLNNKGEGAIIWSQITANGKQPIWYATYKQSAKRFDLSKAIVGAATYSTAPQLAINDQGEMISVWFTTQTGAIQYSVYNKQAKGFNAIGTIEQTQSTDQFPQIYMNDQGDAIMAWGSLGVIKYSFYDKILKKFNNPKIILQY